MKKTALCLILVLWLALTLSACSFSLAEDITPPPGSEQMSTTQGQPQGTLGPLFPLVPPDPAAGEVIYAEKCAPCHGRAGLGDGPQAAQLPNPVPPLASEELARQAIPADWYTQVTRGNLEKFMPPFNSLSDRQRWDVVAYALSLSMPAPVIEQGQQLYQSYCADCHGPQGRGDGPQAANLTVPDLSDQGRMAQLSATDLYTAITQGTSAGMPAYADKLSEDERWALAAYVRSLTFASAPLASAGEATQTVPSETAPTPITPTLESGQVVGTISGKVTNASGGEVPSDLDLTLHGFDDMQMVITQTTTVQADGAFAFENVAMPPGRVFMVTTEYNNAAYSSDIAVAEAGKTSLELPIQIYDTTTDASMVKVDRLHLFFEFVDDQTLRVVQLYVISNASNKTLIPAKAGEPALQFTLPPGAQNLEFQDGALGGRFQKTSDGFGDTAPVLPGSGSHEVLFAFTMPYNRKLDLDQPVSLPVDAVVILVPEGGIKIKSDMLTDEGVRDVQGAKYHLYSGEGLPAGDHLRLTISGRLSSTPPTLASGSNQNLVIGLGFFGLALILAGVWLYLRSRRSNIQANELASAGSAAPTPVSESPQTLMDAIIALDDLYQEGQLPEAAYLQRRAELKARLKEILEG